MTTDDDELDELEEKLEALENIGSQENLSYGSPEPEKKDNMFKFFREILHLPESWKVGNLLDSEIGRSELSVRSNLELAQYAEVEGLDEVSKYFVARADIVASPTMGRKGFMPQLFVTQIKREQKVKEHPIVKKKPWFGGGKQDDEE